MRHLDRPADGRRPRAAVGFSSRERSEKPDMPLIDALPPFIFVTVLSL